MAEGRVAEIMRQSQAFRQVFIQPQSADDIRNAAGPVIGFSEEMRKANIKLKQFLFTRMYRHWRVNRQSHKAQHVTKTMAGLLLHHPELLPDDWRERAGKAGDTAQAAAVVRDYVAGMTDRYALDEFSRLTDPSVPA